MATYVLARDAAVRLAGVQPALTGEHQLHGDALVTGDQWLADAASPLVAVVGSDVLS